MLALALAVILALSVTGFMIAIIIVLKRAKKIPKTTLSKTQLVKRLLYKPTVRHSGTMNLKPATVDDLDTTENVAYEPEPNSNVAAAVDTGENIEIDYEPVAAPLDTNTNISYALHTQ